MSTAALGDVDAALKISRSLGVCRPATAQAMDIATLLDDALALAAGSFGSFANRSSSSDGLLPHERQARQRTATPTPGETTGDGSSGASGAKPPSAQQKRGGSRRGPNEAQAKKSRSVLADVFNTNREPLAPATPKSWSSTPKSSDGAQTATTPPAAGDEPPTSAGKGAGGTPAARHGKGLFNNRKATVHEAPKTGAGQKHNAWGAFSNRKAQTPGHGHSQGNDSTIWSEITRSSRPKGVPHHKPRTGSAAQPGDKPKPAGAASDQDFWGELESRVAGFKGRRGASAGAEEGTPKRFAGKGSKGPRDVTLPKSSTANVQGKTVTHQAPTREEPERQRRKSRFELEEETKEDDRRSKKSKKLQRGRRAQETEDWDDEAIHRWEQRQRRQAEKEARKQKALQQEQAAVPIFLPEYISASNLAQALKQRSEQFMKDMEDMGFENVTSDTIMTGETAALIAMEYGFEPTVDTGSQRDLRPRPTPEDVASLPSRPPVVTIMGHVDHGKTTLLDWLRKSSIAAQEHGGITQHIGAFIVKMSSGKAITFLDTPGHAAFLSMRQRGANVTDIVVLVVAADDSVMPQTVEALKHATAAKVPIIVAINKIDKEDARVDQVKADLARHGVEIEDFGGDVQVVCVSGKTGQGMNDLEENIITLSEILDVRAETDGMAEGWILESSVKQNGKTATVLVKRGTLRPGDLIVAGKTWAKIRVLRNEAGAELPEAPPGTPVEILGWRELPVAGEQVLQAPDEAKAKTAVEYRMEMSEREESSYQLAQQEQRQREKAAAEAAQQQAATEGGSPDGTEEAQAGAGGEPGILYQNFTVKADVAGSVEAVCGSILELGNNEVRPKILRSSAGQISEYDIDHAAASGSVIVNFNVPILPHIKQRAEEAKVRILDHTVIYHVVDDAKATLSALLPETVTYRVSGEADILQVFPINVKKRAFRNIAGCRVRNGSIKRSSRVKVLRKGQVVFDGLIDTLRHVKKDVAEMGKGTECGIGLEGFEEFQVDDQIQTYEEVKEKRTL
ncbi:mitochondrial translation initiation factor [Purpureocillium lavendulum]|uniref:Translation initiation factor IF-2, mitochondrial n=1 Tax=Purpureocillium lavendulum TaxID=1247861 RepID=A0AB34FRY5_9HYPO|nr:mitochondrial translation initiation factor [Purpureocillium lavendulum]